MAIAWDESNPTDTYQIPSYPANARAQRAAVKAAFGIEHDSALGRHKFGYGDAAARNAITDWVSGSVWFLEIDAGVSYKKQVRVGASWLDVVPPSQYANRNESAGWGVPQYASTVIITPGAGTPNTIAVSGIASAHRKVTLTANSKLSNPGAGFPVLASTMVTIEVHQDGTGGRTLVFDSNYVFPGRTVPSISLAASSISLLTLVLLHSGSWIASCAPDLGT